MPVWDGVLPVYLIHWNAPEWCASSVRSVSESEGVNVDVTVIDNGQESGPRLEELLIQNIRILRTTRNLGYSGGANLALEDWRRRFPGSDLCLIGSHDLHVRSDAVEKLVAAAVADNTYGILAPALLAPYRFSGGYWTRWREGQVPLDGVHGVVERDWVPGSCMLLRRGCVESVGGFDESFGSYVEDVDIGLRARSAGWKVGVAAEAISWGLGSVSTHAGPMMIVNRILLVAKRGELGPATLRGVAGLASFGLRALGALGEMSSFWTGPEQRTESKASLGVQAKAMRRIMRILGATWVGHRLDRQRLASRKTYHELQGRAKVGARPSRDGNPRDQDSRRSGKPLATIVVTTDRPRSALRSVTSALQQTIRNIEVIVVDHGSRPTYQPPVGDERIRVIRPDHVSGVCAARNRGLDAARGTWVTFLDEEDELVPDMLEVSLQAASESTLPSPVTALSGMEVVDPSGRTVDVRVPVTRPRGSLFPAEHSAESRPTNTLVAPADVLRVIGGWDEEIMPWVHDDLFLRLGGVSSIQGVQQLTYRTKAHDVGRTVADYLARAEGIDRTLLKHRQVLVSAPQARARLLADMGKSYLKAGRWLRAVGATTQAFFGDPRRPYAFRQWVGTLAGPWAWSWYVRLHRPPQEAPLRGRSG